MPANKTVVHVYKRRAQQTVIDAKRSTLYEEVLIQLHVYTGTSKLNNGHDASNKAQSGRDDCDRKRPWQVVGTCLANLGSVDSKTDHLEHHWQETEADESNDGRVLANGVHAHVDRDQQKCNE